MYKLSIVTPKKVIFNDLAYSLIVPGADGYLEILTNHAPIIVLIKTGRLVVTDSHKNKFVYAISSGFLEVIHNNVHVMADSIELASEIDLKRAESAFDRAQKRLASKTNEFDTARAKRALLRAKNRIETRSFLHDSSKI